MGQTAELALYFNLTYHIQLAMFKPSADIWYVVQRLPSNAVGNLIVTELQLIVYRSSETVLYKSLAMHVIVWSCNVCVIVVVLLMYNK